MKRTLPAFALLFTAAAFAQPGKPAAAFKELTFPQPGRIRVPEPVRFELPNGMTVMLVEDHELPTINVNAMIRAGSRWDRRRQGRAGRSPAPDAHRRRVTRNGDQLDRELDRCASVRSGWAAIQLRRYLLPQGGYRQGDPILADLSAASGLSAGQDRARQNRAARQHRAPHDDPQGIAFAVWAHPLRQRHPYGRQPENATINAITREDLVAFTSSISTGGVILYGWEISRWRRCAPNSNMPSPTGRAETPRPRRLRATCESRRFI